MTTSVFSIGNLFLCIVGNRLFFFMMVQGELETCADTCTRNQPALYFGILLDYILYDILYYSNVQHSSDVQFFSHMLSEESVVCEEIRGKNLKPYILCFVLPIVVYVSVQVFICFGELLDICVCYCYEYRRE